MAPQTRSRPRSRKWLAVVASAALVVGIVGITQLAQAATSSAAVTASVHIPAAEFALDTADSLSYDTVARALVGSSDEHLI